MVTTNLKGVLFKTLLKHLFIHIRLFFLIPKSPFLALKDPNWCNAMYDEYNALVKNGFSRCLFTYICGSILFPHNFFSVLLQQIIDSLHKEFDMTDLGALNYFLGTSVVHHPTGLFLSQKKYALQLLERGHMVNCNPSGTLVDTDSKLGPDGVPGTLELGLHLYASATTSLVGYTDADWAGFPSTCRSTSGYYVFLGDNLLSWSAKRQHTISHSSSEADNRGVANFVAETAWVRNLLRELHSPLLTATMVYCDYDSVVYCQPTRFHHQRTKHIKIDIHFVRDMVKASHVRVLHVPPRFQYADIFTKGLPSALFEDFHSSLA
ncbi:ribonuclease H-like domain-containing protein [Tanacetum coccineum]